MTAVEKGAGLGGLGGWLGSLHGNNTTGSRRVIGWFRPVARDP